MKFSITIPAYKQKFLYEAIESCLAQTYKDFELIIVDDASPEDLKSIVEQFDDKRIRYYRNEKNCGALNVVDNWNICLGYAKGDYVICMGDDDRLLPNCLEEYSMLMDKHPCLNVYHGMTEIIDENTMITGMQEPRPEREGMYSMISGRLRNCRQQYIGDWAFKRTALEHINGYVKMPMAWGSDDLTSYVLAKDSGVANTQVPVFQYRISNLTISNSGHQREKAKIQFDVLNRVEALLEQGKGKTMGTEDVFRNAMLKKMAELKRLTTGGYMRADMRSTGRIKGFAWWLKNIHYFNLPKIEVLKALIKSI